MKKKALISQIKAEANKIEIPNCSLAVKERFQNHSTPVLEIPSSHKNGKKHLPLVRKFAFQFSLIIIVLVLVLIPGLKYLNERPSDQPVPEISKAKKVYALQAISLFNYANVLNDGTQRTSRKANASTNYQFIANQIHKYYLLVDELFNRELVEYELEVLEQGEYRYKVGIKIPLFGENTLYTLCFNEYSDMSGDIDEVSSRLEGVIIQNNVEYRLVGAKELQNDECEIELKLFLSADESDYLEVQQEVEHNENEYEYQYYQNNELIQEFSVSYEIKDNLKVIELEMLNASIKEEYEFSYYQNHILVEYEYDDYQGDAKIFIKETTYEYHFNEDEIIIKNK